MKAITLNPRYFLLLILSCLAALMLISCQTKNTAPDSDPLATPVISPESGTYNDAIEVLINCATFGTTIRYTLDGSDPTSQSMEYTGLLQINSDTTLKARAFKSGFIASTIASAEYVFSTAAVATPVISPVGGNYTTAPVVSITCATAGAEIRYSTDGSDPDELSALYTAPFTVNESSTVKARAFVAGMIPSLVASAAYVMQLPEPQFTPAGGIYPTAQTVTINSPVAGVTIRYTLDGTDPTESSATYTHAINVPVNMVVRAKTYKADWQPSEVVSSIYIINLPDQMQLVPGGTFHNGTS
ncbi:MAG TPA: chitobiase/beta-hexosaminidase C-terminal domain-containing protein, partial [Candidatus Cloacimonadota bacterium]|nr:chitobiase/beta-hexosaminidase C-terminal domain-containing protein [Candidatus Cloacimonadota bacterium]